MGMQRAIGIDERAKNDLNFAIGINRRLLAPLGVWPLRKNASKCEASGRRVRSILSIWIIFLHMIPQYLSIILSERNTEGYLHLVAPQVFDILAMTKFYILLINGKEIGHCLDRIEDDWTNVKLEQDRQTMLKNAMIGRYLTIWCVGCMYGGLIPYNLVLPFLSVSSEEIPENVTLVVEKPLAYPTSYVFLDEQSEPIYEFTWIIQFIGSSYLSALNCGVYTLTAILVAHACGQLQIIGLQLEDVVDGRRGQFPTVDLRLASITRSHTSVIRYVERVNRSLKVSFLVDELGAITVICFAGYSLVTVNILSPLELAEAISEWDYKKCRFFFVPSDGETWNQRISAVITTIYIVLMIANVLNFFVISFVGQQLMDKSKDVGCMAATVQWYRLRPKKARDLILLMARSNKSMTLSACHMFDLSLSNFGDVLRGASVFLNMVRKVTTIK